MKKFHVLVVLFLFVATNGFSQNSLSDYSYIIVPEKFDFQDEKDKYQLNSLTKFLFNKYGFHAYFNREVPRHLKRCDGLWAEVKGTPGFITTVVEVTIKDCNEIELFRSSQGKSKEKDYKKAYNESLREAFESIKKLNVSQKEIGKLNYKNTEVDDKSISNKTVNISSTAIVTIESKQNNNTNNTEFNINISSSENLPTTKFSNYSYKDKTFLLRKTKMGYSFYEESIESDDGLLLIGKIVLLNNKIILTDINNNKFNAQFDTSKNLIIKRGATTEVYSLEN